MSQPLYRDAFETPQSVAYFDPDGLHKQTGRPISDFPAVVVKELVDNALDACESSAAGVAPEVVIHADRQVHDLVLAVGDNGNGIPSDVVERTLNYNTFTSDKALYRTPTRGQQGNALKTIISMPFALGSQHPLVIVQARGIEHRISAGLSAADHPDIRYHVMPCEREVGTAVYVGLPLRAFYASWAEHRSRLRGLARSYHLFNPHAKVIFRASESAVNMVNLTSLLSAKSKKLTFRPTRTTRSSCQPPPLSCTGSSPPISPGS